MYKDYKIIHHDSHFYSRQLYTEISTQPIPYTHTHTHQSNVPFPPATSPSKRPADRGLYILIAAGRLGDKANLSFIPYY